MKVKVLSLLVPALLVAGAANAAEVYNKDGNKLDLYGKVDGLHYFSDDKSVDGDQTYMRLGFKGETQVTDQLTGYGQWEYQIQARILMHHRVIYVMCEEYRAMAKEMGFEVAADVNEALNMALEMTGRDAHIAVILDGVSVMIR